jgi:hypothetical protein
MSDHTPLLTALATRRFPKAESQEIALINQGEVEQFLAVASEKLDQPAVEILLRAIQFRLDSEAVSLEISFISLYAALESILTFFRQEGEFEILGAKEFGALERDLRKWLRQQPSLAAEPAKRGLIYEKIRELNRFPFSAVFKTFCERYALDLSDLWPLTGVHADWPLLEIRHRLVHGDPFEHRPVAALTCARQHLAWTVERMLLCVLGWPVERSNVSRESLSGRKEHQAWRAERAEFSV